MKLATQILVITFWFLASIGSVAQKELAKIEISGLGESGTQVPIKIKIKSGTVAQGSALGLYEIVDGKKIEIPCQIRYGEYDELAFVVESNENPTRKFVVCNAKTLHATSLPPSSKMVSSINDTTIQILKNKNSILHYRHSELPPPPGQGDKWARSGFIHPLNSPSGEVLTWVQPPDHFHHMGIWNPWTRVTWQGHNTDFWNLGDETGTVRFKNIVGAESGDVYAEFRVVHDHVAFLYEGNEKSRTEHIVMTEEWIVRVWNVSDGYLLDFTSIITNVTDDTVSLDAYRYGGGLGYRATEKWNNTNSKVLTSEGKTWEDGDASRAKWCRVSGDLNGIETGLLFMSDPGNYDFPQQMRIWPKNSNGGIGHQYFEFTPIREIAWILESGKSYSQRYRIWVQEGEMAPSKAEAAWKSYADLSEIEISYIKQ